MAYEIHHVSEQIILIVWTRYPSVLEEHKFLLDHKQQLEDATQPLFYISDLRRGKIMSVSTLNEMSKLARHDNYGGGTAFSSDPLSKIMVDSFRNLTREAKERTQIFDTPEEALAFLESLSPGVTDGIDWDAYIQ